MMYRSDRRQPVADPNIIRRLDIGQAAYIYQGGVTYVRIKRPAYTPVPEPAPADVPALPSAQPPTWPHVSWRGPAPALPPAATQPLPLVLPSTEREPSTAAIEDSPRPAQAPGASKVIPVDGPTAFTQAVGPRRTQPRD
jgi:hypothetical protein